MKDTQTLAELEQEIKQQDPAYVPAAGEQHPWRKVYDETLYPELKAVTHARTVTYKVLDTPGNLSWLMRQFGAQIRFNRMSRKREVDIPGMTKFTDDEDNDTLAKVEAIATLNDMPVKNIDKWLDVIAAEHAYHPVVESIKERPWDGVKRLDAFLGTIETTRPEIDRILIKTWMVSAIAACHMREGFVSHGVLVIQGEQGLGKTAWIKKLDPVGAAVRISAIVDPSQRDSLIQLARFWIVELGELDATFRKADIARLKAFITNDVDIARGAWVRKDVGMVRRTVYAATVNDPNFLLDTTGNRRWWTIEATAIHYQHDFDMQQVWAEVKAEWDAGALTYLTPELQQQVNDNNTEHELIDPLKESIISSYDWTATRRERKTVTEMLKEIGYVKPTRGECTIAAKIVIELNGEKGKRSNGVTLHNIPMKLFKS